MDQIKWERENKGVAARNFEEQEIFERALYPIVNVGFKVFEKAVGGASFCSGNASDSDGDSSDKTSEVEREESADGDDEDDKEYDITLTPDEVDLMFVKEYGFPSKLGGPFFWAEKGKSLQELLLGIIKYGDVYKDNRRWVPSELLREVVRSGASIQEELFFQRSKSSAQRSQQ